MSSSGPAFLAAALTFSASSALAVGIDFTGGTTTNVGTVQTTAQSGSAAFPKSTTTAEWQQEGVTTQWLSHTDFLSTYGYTADELGPADFQNLSDSDPGADPYVSERMVVSRTDGGLFDLGGISAGRTYEAFGIYVEFKPEPGSGAAPADFTAPFTGPSLSLTGRKADGTIVEGTGTTKTYDAWALGGFDASFFGPTDVIFSPEVQAAFTSLTEMTVRVFADYYSDDAARYAAALETLTALNAPSVLLEGIEACGVDRGCTVDGLGEFSIYSGEIGGRNDYKNVFVTGFDVDFVDGVASEPASVPLPASGFFLLAGLTGLAVARRRKTA